METSINGEPAQKDKKIVDRSASYPSIPLDEAIEFALSVAKNFPNAQTLNRDDIATVLKKKAASIQRDVATCSQFGLFNKTKDGYSISDLLRAINHPISEKERRKNLIEAFKSPKLYKDLIEKYDAHAIPTDLKPLLIRFHDISEKAASEAGDIFIKSANSCGVLSDFNILNVNQSLSKLNDGNVDFVEVITEEPKENQNVEKFTQQLLPPKNTNEEKFTIRLTDKKYAQLIVPSDITLKDIEILRKQIEVLELTAS